MAGRREVTVKGKCLASGKEAYRPLIGIPALSRCKPTVAYWARCQRPATLIGEVCFTRSRQIRQHCPLLLTGLTAAAA